MVSHIGIFQLIVYQCPYEILCMNEFNNQSVILFNYIRGGGGHGGNDAPQPILSIFAIVNWSLKLLYVHTEVPPSPINSQTSF